MNKENTEKLIKKYKYMFSEMDRSLEIQKRQSQLMNEIIKAQTLNDEIKIAQIKEEQRELGLFYPIAFGFDCGDGWFDLLDELMAEIEKLDVNKTIVIVQIKEKFGGLRFYVDEASEKIYDVINKYENKSYKICETCGKPGKISGTYWLKATCPEHTKDQIK